MLRKTLIAASLAFQPSPGLALDIVPQPPVPLVVCRHKYYWNSGSAFRVGPNLLLTAAHVSNSGNCDIDGQSIHIVYTSPTADYAVLSDERKGEFIRGDCGGFVKGRKYYAIGHARGLPQLAIIPLVATGETEDGFAVLDGIFTAQPGQSGGPVIDAETMKVVGIVNAASWEKGLTYSIALRDTPICKVSA